MKAPEMNQNHVDLDKQWDQTALKECEDLSILKKNK